MSEAPSRSLAGPYRMRTLLIIFVAAMTLPLAILSVALFFRQLAVDQAETESRLLERTKALTDEIDLELARVTVVAETLAVSQSLEIDNLVSFYEQASRTRDVIKATVVLRDLSGQQLLNTRIPYGEILPRNPIFEVDRRAIESRQVQVSDLLTDGVSQPILAVVAPVLRNGEPRYLLSITIFPERLQALIAPDRLPAGWTAAIVDRDGVLLARSHNAAAALGSRAPAEVWSTIGTATEGIRRFKGQFGGVFLAAFARSQTSGWIVTTGISDEFSIAGWRQSTLILGAACGVLFVLGLAMALWGARLFSADVDQLKVRAEALGSGVEPPSAQKSVSEMEAISQALKKASELIHQRTSALAQAQKMEAVGQLTSGVAHDFNNVLGVVVSNLDLLLEQVPPQSQPHQFAEAALNASMKGADLVQRLLAFSRKQTLELKLVDLGAVLHQMMPLLNRTISDRITKELKVEPGVWPVIADAVQLESCVLNLSINARDAMPDGGRLKIDCRNLTVDEHLAKAYPELAFGDYVVVSVTDTGTGIAPENLERVFEPFFTTKEIGAGSGLGLSMVFGTMRQSGGTVKIYSEVGNGTTVSLYLPKAVSAEAVESATKTAPEKSARGAEHILVVEDNAEMRHVAIATLESLGYRTTAAETGDAALEILEKGARFDLIFTDIMMPGKRTGIDLVKEARARGMVRKVIFTSGFASPIALQEAAQGEGDIVVRKPYRKAVLAATVRKVLDAASV